MQAYNYQFSANVVERFLSIKKRGWDQVRKHSELSERVLIYFFRTKQGRKWEACKKFISHADRLCHLPGPSWSDSVWVEQLSRLPSLKELNKVLNKCLVLTDARACDRVGSTLKPGGNPRGSSEIPKGSHP